MNTGQGVIEAMLSARSTPEGSTQLQLLAPLTPESTIARFLDRSGPGLQQLAYRVADVEGAAEPYAARVSGSCTTRLGAVPTTP